MVMKRKVGETGLRQHSYYTEALDTRNTDKERGGHEKKLLLKSGNIKRGEDTSAGRGG